MSKYSLRKKRELILSEEAARDQIVELLEYYDIDVDGDTSDERANQGVEKILDKLTTFVRQGVLEVGTDDKGKIQVKHNLSGGESLVYGEINARAKVVMEKCDQNANYSRVYALMGSLCGLGKGAIEKLPAKDLNVVEVLGTVFMIA